MSTLMNNGIEEETTRKTKPKPESEYVNLKVNGQVLFSSSILQFFSFLFFQSLKPNWKCNVCVKVYSEEYSLDVFIDQRECIYTRVITQIN